MDFTQCFVTRQPVVNDDLVMLLPVRRNSGGFAKMVGFADRQYSVHALPVASESYDTFWKPVAPFLQASFNGESGFVLLQTHFNRSNLLQFFGQLHVLAGHIEVFGSRSFDFQTYVSQHAPLIHSLITRRLPAPALEVEEVPLWREIDACWRYVWKAMEDQEVFVSCMGGEGRVQPVELAVMHAHTYQGLADCHGDDRSLRNLFDQALLDAKTASAAQKHGARDWVDALQVHFWERVFDVGHGTRLISLEHCFDIAQAHATGKLDDEGLYQKVRPWLVSAFALAALHKLGVRITPMVSATGMTGDAYLRLVQKVHDAVLDERILRLTR